MFGRIGQVGRLLAPALLCIYLFRGAFAGFSCLSNPCEYGICIDDINSTYSCYCMDGYTGVHCQTNWDECWSNPCMNDGLCQDGVAAFNCTCSPGFQGDFCEINFNECESNPCHNNGTCVDGANGYSCACLAGYSGPYCEHDISVCNGTEEARCENGGLCIEGPGIQFSCVCQAGWAGEMCETPIDECNSSPCRNGAVCLDHHANYSCACPFGYSGRNCETVLEMCDANNPCENGAMCLIEDMLSICYCVPDFHGDKCQFQYDECLLGPGCKNGGTCIDGVDEFTCSCPADLTGDLCECLIIGDGELNCSYVAPTTLPTSPPSTAQTTAPPTFGSLPTTVPPHWLITSDYTDFFGVTKIFSYFTTTEETTIARGTSTSEVGETTLVDQPQPSSEPEATMGPGVPDENEITDQTLVQIPITKPTTEEESFTQKPTTPAEESPPMTTSQEKVRTTTDTLEDQTVTDIDFTTHEIFFPTKEPALPDSDGEKPNCRRIPCLNGGLCLQTSNGLKCVCTAGWEGDQCEARASVKIAAFSGQSYVVHKTENASHTQIEITGRTVAVAGLILYSSLAPGIYQALYLEDGLLKFKFSCGFQTMLLSEMQFHINNGYDLVATVTLEFLPGEKRPKHCLATVRVNNTHAMSGEQMAAEPPRDQTTSVLYLGGLPPTLDLELPVHDGFVGCMHDLAIDHQPRNILKEATESFDIKECLSLACLSDPCHNGATCVERENEWSCQCPSGYLGNQCEKSVCENSPCEYGGTCVGFPGSGFICLCPLGKHGQFCEYDLDIGQPVYSSSVSGLSSFSAHPLPTEINQNMVISFKFIPHDMEQISLMAFLGQDGPHGHGSDHLAISLIKGYVVLTWNLGSGPRRIFTSKPVDDYGHRPHYVQVGREGQKAWLVVDNLGNVTGKSPGTLSELNTRSILYLGGHESGNFSLLPHDLPLHTGFSGCLYDVRLQTGHMMMMIQQTKTTTGRSVGQCGTSLCHEHACQHGSGCIHHGATFTCLCADGWFGPSCGMARNPCDSGNHNCSNGGTCVPQRSGYSCDCPLGRSGEFCENDERLSDIRFSGIRSYLAVAAEGLQEHRSCLELEVMPTENHGLVLYTGRSDSHQYVALSLHGGILELRVSPGLQRRRGEPLVIRSRRLMALGRWHKIRVARYGRRLFLWVEGTANSATLFPGEAIPSPSSTVYIGGVPDLSTLPAGVVAGHVTSFKGCVRRFSSQWKWMPLNESTILSARNIVDCDGTRCGGDVCSHGGSCNLDEHGSPQCHCINEYTGDRCEIQLPCTKVGCKNGGRCIEDKISTRCSCPLGKGGQFCEIPTSVETPSFGGDGYIMIDRTPNVAKQENALETIQVDFVYLNFSTVYPNGLILWTSRLGGQEFLGVGIEDNRLKLVWVVEGKEAQVLTVPGGPIADGTWHDIAVSLVSGNISIWSDHRPIASPQSSTSRPISTDGRFFLGGLPPGVSVRAATRGHFAAPFRGCLQKLAWGVESVVSNFSSFSGENVNVCDPFKP